MPKRYDEVWLTARLLRKHKIDIPMDPWLIVCNNRWQVTTFKLMATVLKQSLEKLYDDASDGTFSFYSTHYKTYTIVMRDDYTVEDMYFSMAHEIGHIIMGHVSPTRTLYFTGSALEEYQANRVAAYILGIDKLYNMRD